MLSSGASEAASPSHPSGGVNMSRKATRIGALRERIGDEVLLEGWLYNRRSSGKLEFLLVRDGSGTVQCVAVKAELPEEVFARCATVTQESSLRVTGVVREDKRAPSGVELSLRDIQSAGARGDFPTTPTEHGAAFLLYHRP